ncbi:FecR domain-containing protein [Porticoccaceae bacterium LTM1]|nr:FecR domain-containing protein [Porticoccaceae bacterium LTM1]
MKATTETNREDHIEEAAAEWVLRFSEGSLTDETMEQWKTWMEAHPDHRRVYEKMSMLWGMADELDAIGMDNVSDSAAQQKPSIEKGPSWIERFRGWFTGPRVAMVSSVALAATVALVFVPFEKDPIEASKLEMVAGMSTPKGEHRQVELPDGTDLELGADSELRFAYSDTERRVILKRGEALFNVASDPNRPFIVDTGVGEYQALGTAYNVRLSAQGSTLTVLEGMVQASVSTPDADYNGFTPPRLIAGEGLSITTDGHMGEVYKVDLNAVASWREGLFSYVDAPLKEVFSDLNRYSEQKLELDAEAGELRYTGTIHKDRIEGAISALPDVFPVRVIRLGNRILVRAK